MIDTIVRTAACTAIVFAFGSARLPTEAQANGQGTVTTVKLSDIKEHFVPTKLVAGDREFGGNGPKIRVKTTLFVTPDKKRIIATTEFNARETKADWSETEGDWTRTVYTAPKGKVIESIVDGTVSSVEFVSKPAGMQILGPSEDFAAFLTAFMKVSEALLKFASAGAAAPVTPGEIEMKALADKVIAGSAFLKGEGNHVHVRRPASGPVQAFAVVGDTGGPDISTDDNPKDDTRINGISFKPLKIRLK